MSEQYLTIDHLTLKDITRIFSKIHISTEHFYNGSPCWEWVACKNTSGYGKTIWCRKSERTHRLLFSWLVAPVPYGRKQGELDHLCRRRHCCNPAHLELVSTRVNLMRGQGTQATNARKTHCIHGHLFDEINTYSNKPGHRYCRTCRKQKRIAWRLIPENRDKIRAKKRLQYQETASDPLKRAEINQRGRENYRKRKLSGNLVD